MSQATRRVVVTGLGVVSPLGCSVQKFWSQLLAGKSGIVAVKGQGYESVPSRIAGLVDPDETEHFNGGRRKISRSAFYSLNSAEQAMRDGNLQPRAMTNTGDIGVMIGIGMVNLSDVYSQWELFNSNGYRKVSPWFIQKILPNHAAGVIALKHNIKGLVHCISTACATGAHAIGDAYRLIKSGELDAVIVGAVDSSVDPLTLAGFARMRALTTTANDSPEQASMPFDARRRGFVLSEGAAVVLLESEQHALARSAPKIYCEVDGYGYSSDSYHISAPPADGKGAALAMKKVLSAANLLPSDIGYISAHATSTPLGDSAEAAAISSVFGKDMPFVSSIKGAIGHLLGAAGAVESVATILSVYDNVIPGTTGLLEKDESLPRGFAKKLLSHGCTESYSPGKSRIALKNSFGFFGANASLCFSEYK